MRLSGVIACVAVVLRFCSAEISSIGLRGKLECPPNERYYEMRPSACSKDCESIGKPCKEQSKIPHVVRSGCDCREGFYRMQKTGKCLPTIECLRARCPGQHEIYKPCGQADYCEPTCGKEKEPCKKVFVKCPDGCQCEFPFKRHPSTGKCVSDKDCPKKCGKFEVHTDCYSPCQDECPGRVCIQSCSLKNTCKCVSGMVRVNGVCISNRYCDWKPWP